MAELDPMTTLKDILSLKQDRTWYFIRPGGNWGDSLIYMGGESLARSMGLQCVNLDYDDTDFSTFPEGACIYLHGGGGFNPWGKRRAFGNLQKAASVPGAFVVQAPQSAYVEGQATTAELFEQALANRKCEAVHFFAREHTSLKFFREILPSFVNIYIDHDTALHIPQQELLDFIGLTTPPKGRYELVVSREDEEAPSEPLFFKNAVTMDPAYFATSFAHWVRVHAYASKITTNRIHSAVVCSILGKPVDLLSGNYHKNRSIWEYSLAQRNVVWHDQPLENSGQTTNYLNMLPPFLAKSWKVQRMMMRLRGVPLE